MEELFKLKEITAVVPVYNEQSLIDELVKRVDSSLRSITDNYEILIIDDGSSDETWKEIHKNKSKFSNLKALRFSRNFGHHYAISAGLHECDSKWTVVMDGDLQDRPEVIPELYKKANEGFDVVFVSRINRPEKLMYRSMQKLFYMILRLLSGINFDSSQANFSIISNKVVLGFRNFPENARFYGSTIKWLGFPSASIEADHGVRFSGKPSYTFKKRLNLALDVILAFSDRPLKIAIRIGIVMSTVSFIASLAILYRAFMWGYEVLGWPSLILSIYFTAGIILTVLGIIGVYIGQIFKEVKKRPLYMISESLS